MVTNEILKKKIEHICVDLYEAHPWFIQARSGETKKGQVFRYLRDVHFILSQSTRHLLVAAHTARKENRAELSKFFLEKIKEEEGHEKWAAADIQKMGQSIENGFDRTEAANDLMEFIDLLVTEYPRGYLLYVCLVEYLTVSAGAMWIKDVVNQCGLDPNGLSVIGNHVILDKDHVDGDYEVIIREFIDDNDVAIAVKTMDKIESLLESFFSEMARGFHENTSTRHLAL